MRRIMDGCHLTFPFTEMIEVRPCLARPTTLDDLRDHRQVLRRCCLPSVVLIVRLRDMQCDNIRPWPRMRLRDRP